MSKITILWEFTHLHINSNVYSVAKTPVLNASLENVWYTMINKTHICYGESNMYVQHGFLTLISIQCIHQTKSESRI